MGGKGGNGYGLVQALYIVCFVREGNGEAMTGAAHATLCSGAIAYAPFGLWGAAASCAALEVEWLLWAWAMASTPWRWLGAMYFALGRSVGVAEPLSRAGCELDGDEAMMRLPL